MTGHLKAWSIPLLALAALCACDRAGPSAVHPNIILITIESLRADHVGCYGYGRDTTPALDALAREGILYEQARSVTSWTLPSHATMFTGLYPTAHQVITPHDRLKDAYGTLAEKLKSAGYDTAAFVSGPFLRGVHNLGQGFDLYDETGVNASSPIAANGDITNPWMERRIGDWVRARGSGGGGKPFFLFAYLWDPHYDYIPPSPYDAMFVSPGAEPIDLHGYENRDVVNGKVAPAQLDYVLSQYDGEIRWTDDMLGRLFRQLKAQGLWESTAIVVTADHGEEFFDHGHKGHKNNLYVESLHVPLVIKLAGRAPARRDGRIANLVRLYPTLLELAGLEPDQPWLARSLLKPRLAQSRPTFYELKTSLYVVHPGREDVEKKSEDWYAIREGDLKLVHVEQKEMWQLFDLARDPGERRPLPAAADPRSVRLREALERHSAEMRRIASVLGKAERLRFTPQEVERLKSLGYVGGSK